MTGPIIRFGACEHIRGGLGFNNCHAHGSDRREGDWPGAGEDDLEFRCRRRTSQWYVREIRDKDRVERCDSGNRSGHLHITRDQNER